MSAAGSDDVAFLSARGLIAAYRERSLSPVEVVEALLARVEAADAGLGAFTTVCGERALIEARACEDAYARGTAPGPLGGVPLAVKDLVDSAEVRTTYGSPMFADYVPATDAEALRRARAAGAILIGKAQTHEFAWGISSVNELMGTSRNPWRPTHMSGGSSGGCAVALAAGMVPLAIGSDTGGSIRVPSGFCGTVGLKPTYASVSTAGVRPLAPSLDHVGAMARTPDDAALLLAAMGGPDAASAGGGPDVAAGAPLDGLRVGVCRDLHLVPLSDAVASAFDAAVAATRAMGAEVVELELPEAGEIHPAFVVIQRAEALRSHVDAGLWPERRSEYGADVRGRLEAAGEVTPADYLAATETRERTRAAFARLFDAADVLLTPTAAASPLAIGTETAMHAGREIDLRGLTMPYTVPHDLFGVPTCTVRAGFDELGIPIGVQLAARHGDDAGAVRATAGLHAATPDLQRRRPALAGHAARSEGRDDAEQRRPARSTEIDK